MSEAKHMPNCPKCGGKVTEAMSFCPNCGASLKAAAPPTPAPPAAPAPAPAPAPVRREKGEKGEKQEKGGTQEKGEKGEKHEKGAMGPIGPVIGGAVLIVLGLLFYLGQTLNVPNETRWAYFFVIIGIVIILAALYGTMVAARRHPPT